MLRLARQKTCFNCKRANDKLVWNMRNSRSSNIEIVRARPVYQISSRNYVQNFDFVL